MFSQDMYYLTDKIRRVYYFKSGQNFTVYIIMEIIHRWLRTFNLIYHPHV